MNEKTYTVTATEQQERFGANGKPKTIYVVYLTTDRGVSGSLEVSKADWNAETLPGLLQAKADELDLAMVL